MNGQAAVSKMLVGLGIVCLVFLAGCGDSTSQAFNKQPPSAPTITTISPNSVVAGSTAFTLTVHGNNFVPASVVQFSGTVHTATFVSSTQVTAAIPAAAIAAAGTAAVTVINPAPGGGITSNVMNFAINSSSGTNLPWTTVAVADQFAYVTNSNSNNVSLYSISSTGSLELKDRAATGTSPIFVAVDSSDRFVYVANEGSNDISMYATNSSTGALDPLGTIAAGMSPNSVAVDPSGKFVYVANEGSNDISMYTISGTTPTLTPLGTVAAGVQPNSVAVDPTGKFAYVTNANLSGPPEVNTNNGDVAMFRITSTGILEPLGTIATGMYPRSVVVDPSGKFVYVANCGDFERNQGYVAMYTINTTGTLTSIGTIDAGSCPLSLALHPSGKFAYVANIGSDGGPDIEVVSMYKINPTGTLTSMGFVFAGNSPSFVAVNPSGKFAYVTNHVDNTISMYTIDPTTGFLTLIGTIGT